ncbi:MAG: hypothetical protein AAF539_08190 [Planctomycetota bacterium]
MPVALGLCLLLGAPILIPTGVLTYLLLSDVPMQREHIHNMKVDADAAAWMMGWLDGHDGVDVDKKYAEKHDSYMRGYRSGWSSNPPMRAW